MHRSMIVSGEQEEVGMLHKGNMRDFCGDGMFCG